MCLDRNVGCPTSKCVSGFFTRNSPVFEMYWAKARSIYKGPVSCWYKYR